MLAKARSYCPNIYTLHTILSFDMYVGILILYGDNLLFKVKVVH
jgi:hypothetical protein